MRTAAPTPHFGTLLKRFRRAAGLTQEALAERARLSVRGIQNLERGVSGRPRPDTVALLAAALGLIPDEYVALEEAARRPAPSGSGPVPSVGTAAAGALPTTLTPLIGREHELALLSTFLTGMGTATQATTLLLAGEPGIGKTRLLQAAVQEAVARGWAVLAGGCHRGGQAPFAPLLDSLERQVHALRPERLGAALHGCAWLVRLLPELADVLEPLPPGDVAPEQERRLLFAAVGRFLANVAGPAGTLLVLDDLQWAGPDALDLLATLAHRGPSLRLVAGYRDTEVRPADPLGLLMADLAQAGRARHHVLGPLAAEDAAALLDGLLGDRAVRERAEVERVVQRAGGVPFFLISYVEALHQGSAEAVPWDLAQGVRQRVALLPAASHEVLGAAAVVGHRAPRALLLAATGQAEQEVLSGLEAACRARLLLEDGDDAYAFAHDVVRDVVEAELGPARRALLHRRVAAALEADPVAASAERLAYHYARGGLQEPALRYLELAGDHAWSQRAHGAAERHYHEAMERLEAAGRVHEVLRVREKLGEVLYRIGRNETVIGVLEPAAQRFQAAAKWEDLTRVMSRIGWTYAWLGRPREGLARLQPVLEALERAGATPPLATLYEAVGQLLLAAGQYEESLAAHEHMATLARRGGDERLQVLAEGHRVNLLQMLGRIGEALRLGQQVLPTAEAMGDRDTLRRMHGDLAYLHTLRGSWAAARRHLARALDLSEQLGDPAEVAFTLALQGWLAILSGDWPDARADLDRALELGCQADDLRLTYTLIVRAKLALRTGERAACWMVAQEALARAEADGDLQALRWAARILAELELLEGRAEAAVARLEPLRDRPCLQEYDVTALLPVLAWAYLEQGRLEEAETAVEQALERARAEEMHLVLVEALRVQALIALRQEERPAGNEAAHSLEEGLALARAMPHPYAVARFLEAYADLHAKQGELRSAHDCRAAAQAIRRRLGGSASGAGPATATATEHPLHSAHTGPEAGKMPDSGPSARRTNGPATASRRLSPQERTAWVLRHMGASASISTRAYAEAVGVSPDTALNDLRALAQRHLVCAHGTTKNRQWSLVHGQSTSA